MTDPIEIEAKPLLIQALVRSIAQKAGGRIALFTQAGVFIGVPSARSPFDQALERGIERIKAAAPGRAVRMTGGGSVQLREAVFVANGPNGARVNVDQVFVFLDDVIGVTPAATWVDGARQPS